MFCDPPPLPDPKYDLSMVNESYYQYSPWGDFRVPLDGQVSTFFKLIFCADVGENEIGFFAPGPFFSLV